VEDAYLYHEIHRTAVEWRICGRRPAAAVMTKVEEQKRTPPAACLTARD
jgi:hypothetical protein